MATELMQPGGNSRGSASVRHRPPKKANRLFSTVYWSRKKISINVRMLRHWQKDT